MLRSHDENVIQALFRDLQRADVRFVLLRDIGNVLPQNYKDGQSDIDILVHPDDGSAFTTVLNQSAWFKVLHPYDNLKDFTFLYGMTPFEFYIKGHAKLDICYEISCRSPNGGEWIPLDMELQESAWTNRIMCEDKGCHILCPEDEIVHLMSRSVFDKRTVSLGYRSRIVHLAETCDMQVLRRKLDVVFFAASNLITSAVKQGDFDNVVSDYYGFGSY